MNSVPRIGITANVKVNDRQELDFVCGQKYYEAVWAAPVSVALPARTRSR